jgi:ABC-2 type transport system permease protein
MLDVLRSRSTTSFVLLFPILLLVVVGLVFMNGHPFERRVVLLVAADAPTESQPEGVVRALSEFEEVTIDRTHRESAALGRLRARMASAVWLEGTGGAPARLLVGPRDRLFARGVVAVLPEAPKVEIIDVPRWGYVHYLFPGILTFSIMISGLFAMGYTMVLYRQNRFLKKLATTPLPKLTFVAAQIVGRGALILLQAVILVAVAVVAFGLPTSIAALAWLSVVTLLGLLTFMGVGFALACLVRTEDIVVDIINAINIPLVLLSEIFFPLDALPRPLAVVGGMLPSTVMVRLVREVLLYGGTGSATVPGLGVLALWAAATFAASMMVFRWHA